MSYEVSLLGGGINQINCKFTTILNKRAYQCTATGMLNNIVAGWVGTSFVLKDHLVNTYIIFPMQMNGVMQPFPWHDYFAFTNSIKFLIP